MIKENISKILTCLFTVLLTVVYVSGQQKDVSEITVAKVKLENLQKQFWAIDDKQRNQVKSLKRKKLVKDEFETTEQFEQRKGKLDDEILIIEAQILEKKGEEREKIQKQISEILAMEFVGETQIQLSYYDADNTRYTISSKDGIAFQYLVIPITEAKSLKEGFSEAKITGVSALVLNEDNKPAEYLLSVKINLQGKVYSLSNSTLTKVKAMQMLFGNYDFKTKSSSWKTYKTEYSSEDDEENIVLANVSSSILFFEAFKERATEKYFLVANDESSGDCGACRGLPSFAVFTKESNYWKIESAQKNSGEIGVYGKPGEPSLVKIGSEKYALKFSWWYMQMGYETTGNEIWAFIDGTLRKIVEFYTSSDNSGAVDDSNENFESSKSKIIFSQGSNPDFFDIKISTTGKKAVKIGRKFILKPFTKLETYSFIGGRYELVK